MMDPADQVRLTPAATALAPGTTTPGMAPPGPLPTAPDGWEPLPRRARALFLLRSMPTVAVPAAAMGFLLGSLIDSPADSATPWLAAVLALLAGAGFGLWLGVNQYRCSFWRHDAEGLAVRRGRFWLRETRVPATRVQHLDLTRGPLQRRRDLATLVVHTAGTRHSAVSVAHLDAGGAERLREALSRQIGPEADEE